MVVRHQRSPGGAGPRWQLPWAQNTVNESREQTRMGKWGRPSTSGFSQNIIHIASASERLQELFQKQVPRLQRVKNPPAMRETWAQSWVGKIPWGRAWQPTLVFLAGDSPRTEEPGGLYSPWGHKESDTGSSPDLLNQNSCLWGLGICILRKFPQEILEIT